MRFLKLTYQNAKILTFSALYLPLSFVLLYFLANLNSDSAVLAFPLTMIIFIVIVAGNADVEENIYFWEKGFKRKFRVYEGFEGKAFVETKVGFFWIPIKKPIEEYGRRYIPMEFPSTTEAMDYIYKKRGYSGSKLTGKFEC